MPGIKFFDSKQPNQLSILPTELQRKALAFLGNSGLASLATAK